METQIQSVEDSLIEGLSFRLPNSANFIQDRRSVTYLPSGGDTFSPRGVKMIKFMLAGPTGLTQALCVYCLGSKTYRTQRHCNLSTHFLQISSDVSES